MAEQERWWLDDAEAAHAAAPGSFFIPPEEKRRSLSVGDHVKLLFRFAPGGDGYHVERMWVEVSSAGQGRYTGKLLNQPRYMTSLRDGIDVEFGPEHVAGYEWSEGELGYDPAAWAWARQEFCAQPGERPLRVTMRPPQLRAGQEDSGWLAARGDEGPSEVTDERMFQWTSLGWLTDLVPQLADVFRAGDGDWRWSDATRGYVRSPA